MRTHHAFLVSIWGAISYVAGLTLWTDYILNADSFHPFVLIFYTLASSIVSCARSPNRVYAFAVLWRVLWLICCLDTTASVVVRSFVKTQSDESDKMSGILVVVGVFTSAMNCMWISRLCYTQIDNSDQMQQLVESEYRNLEIGYTIQSEGAEECMLCAERMGVAKVVLQCCKGKEICEECYDKVRKKSCPFCRCDHDVEISV